MNNTLLYVSLISLLFSCNPKGETVAKKKILNQVEINETLKVLNPRFIDIPEIEKVDITNISRDTIKNYESGDCGGNITKLNNNYIRIEIDSSSCGDYGFNYTKFIYEKERL